ncbi:glycerophosphodiester phosphodiesterase family protein [Crocosphaera sp. XPORK-15E]|uniref:glycerophosphodiester phosphodiesterase family protein n=1 Tax=Crocosphaera sp. XPORK-15E TaxID=3110247 RepID=UPI002B21ACB8|nr:glycerophosphodiester phosphodiesterase family protein [Crocosphaera sp. XPORK-15E]MEA5534539.1 glycerophosphodiester phosphodiesterase family protein [Crocosphaera sp. XPORK-15E]
MMIRLVKVLLLVTATLSIMPTAKVMANTLVIGHRGASAFRPEHTLAAYELAIDLGADFVEPDLVSTRDGVLIARHENDLSGTTDVASKFPDRLTTKMIDGDMVTGYFSEDFTLAELKTLRAVERIPGTRPGNTIYDGMFEIPTLEEIIDLVNQKSAETGRDIGIYPETKHPTFFAEEGTFFGGAEDGDSINISLGQLLINTLVANNFTDPNRVFIQSFEFANLIELQNTIMPNAGVDIPLVQLYGSTNLPTASSFDRPYDIFFNAQNGADLSAIYGCVFTTAEGGGLDVNTGYGNLDNAATLQCMGDTYAEGVGPWKNSLLPRISIPPVDGNGDGNAQITSQLTGEVTPFVDDAHAAGLVVHPYTLRPEEVFLTLNADGTPQTLADEVKQLVGIGVDGLFCDDPGTCRQTVDELEAASVPEPSMTFGLGVLPLLGWLRRRRNK